MKSKWVSRALLVLLALHAAPIAAQRLDSPYRFLDHGQQAGVFASYLLPSEGRLGVGPQSSPGVGLRYGIAVSGPFSVEVEALFSSMTRSVVDTSFTTPDSARVVRGEGDFALLAAMGSVRLSLTGNRTWNGLQPFALFGAGVVSNLAGDSPADTLVAEDARFTFGTSFAGQLGAGAEYFFSQRWSARFDARTALWKLKNPVAFRLGERGRLVPADEWEGNSIFSAGLSLHF